MKKKVSPIGITYPRVHGYTETRKQAKEIVKNLNAKSIQNYYWYISAKKLAE